MGVLRLRISGYIFVYLRLGKLRYLFMFVVPASGRAASVCFVIFCVFTSGAIPKTPKTGPCLGYVSAYVLPKMGLEIFPDHENPPSCHGGKHVKRIRRIYVGAFRRLRRYFTSAQ